MLRNLMFLVTLAATVCVAAKPALAADPSAAALTSGCRACERKAADVARCDGIDPAAYFTGMLFNPQGMQTGYERASCFNRLALEYRDLSLCAEVRERGSLFFDGSALSRQACEQRVREAAAGDRQVVIADIHRLDEVQWFRNGNGRDFDVHVRTVGSYAHRYALTVQMLDAGGRRRTLWHREIGLRAGNIGPRALVRSADMDAAAAALGVQPPYRLRVSLALVEPGIAEVAQFAEMPPAERQSSVERVIDPAALQRDPRDLAGQ